ncbi:hypothetical protein K9N08_02095 [Candidatus Gracilibacteria bacterium]|nr:hypothetical protein [Candidatus Gracilibacteria bacterium]MCF7896683.1 hypothetical protein [Candidatus Gracilibacteria bacterium]
MKCSSFQELGDCLDQFKQQNLLVEEIGKIELRLSMVRDLAKHFRQNLRKIKDLRQKIEEVKPAQAGMFEGQKEILQNEAQKFMAQIPEIYRPVLEKFFTKMPKFPLVAKDEEFSSRLADSKIREAAENFLAQKQCYEAVDKFRSTIFDCFPF